MAPTEDLGVHRHLLHSFAELTFEVRAVDDRAEVSASRCQVNAEHRDRVDHPARRAAAESSEPTDDVSPTCILIELLQDLTP